MAAIAPSLSIPSLMHDWQHCFMKIAQRMHSENGGRDGWKVKEGGRIRDCPKTNLQPSDEKVRKEEITLLNV